MRLKRLTMALVLAGAGWIGMSACSSDGDLAAGTGGGAVSGAAGSAAAVFCGPGTRLESNRCVVDDAGNGGAAAAAAMGDAGGPAVVTCGPGTRLEDGQCVVDSTGSGGAAGTPSTGDAGGPTAIRCGPGTRPVAGICVIDDTGAGGSAGATSSSDAGAPTVVACGPGTRLVAGVCVVASGGSAGSDGIGGRTAASGGRVSTAGQSAGGGTATGGTTGSAGSISTAGRGAGGSTVGAGGVAGDTACNTGREGCACFWDDTCFPELTCVSGLCEPTGTGGAVGAGGAPSFSGVPCSGLGDPACDDYSVCVLGYCRPPCGTDAECPPRAMCTGLGIPFGCTLPGEGLCSEGENCAFNLSCGIDGRCRIPCSDATDCPRNEHHCIAGTCVGESESEYASTWGACDEGEARCNDDYSRLQSCSVSEPGWNDGEVCPESQPFCEPGDSPACNTCAGFAAARTGYTAEVDACLADAVCAACLETQQPSCETSEPYRELVSRLCEDLRSFLGEWIGSTCCDSICVWEGGSCEPTTLCCGGIPCQGGICTV